MILLIDNYDSFSYNLYQLIGSVNPDIRVIRNDERTVEEIEAMGPELIVLSPSPPGPVCVKRWSESFPAEYRCLGFAWAIRPSVRPLARKSDMQNS